jgi:hypothetical protein
MPAIDRDAPLRFLRTAFQSDDRVAIFLKCYHTRRVAQRVGPLPWVMHSRFQAWLRAKNAERFNVYVGVNSIAPGRRARTRDAIGEVRHVFLDADHDGPKVLEQIAARRDLPAPSYVIHSSPDRVHVLWRVSGFHIDRVEALQKKLARDLGTDPAATPITQTTRLPGFLNHKYSQAYPVTAEYCSAARIYEAADFPDVEDAAKPTFACPVMSRPWSAGIDRVDRARRYLERVPPAVSGEHGDLRTFRVCCRVVRGFALDDADALLALRDWNTRCEPPWPECELVEKLRRARRYGREPIGGLLSASVQSSAAHEQNA